MTLKKKQQHITIRCQNDFKHSNRPVYIQSYLKNQLTSTDLSGVSFRRFVSRRFGRFRLLEILKSTTLCTRLGLLDHPWLQVHSVDLAERLFAPLICFFQRWFVGVYQFLYGFGFMRLICHWNSVFCFFALVASINPSGLSSSHWFCLLCLQVLWIT